MKAGETRTTRVRKTPIAVGKPMPRRPEIAHIPPAPDSQTRVNADELRAMVAQAAYLRAEKRGFQPGHEVEDWLEAEAEIVLMLGGLTKA